MTGFPQTIFGLCPLGANAVEGTSAGDVPVTDSTVRGVPLEWYPRLQIYCCRMCIDRLEADQESLRSARRHLETQRFLAKAGFKTSV